MLKNKVLETPFKKGKPDGTDQRPFGDFWIDSCYQETLLPDLAWTKVKPKICDALAQKIYKQINQPERMQMIFELVGPGFKSAYFADWDYEPLLLEPPHMNNEQREKLRSEAQTWLNNQAYRAAKECGCGRVLPGMEPSDDLCDEQMRFLQNVFDIFVKGLDRHLYKKELEVLKKKREAEEEAKVKKKKAVQEVDKVQVLAVRRESALSSISSLSRRSTPFNDKVSRLGGGDPAYYSSETEVVGDSIKSILQRDPRRFLDVSRRLHGRQLPNSLRSYMWLDVLFKNDRERLREGNVEKIVRERFGRAVARGVGDLKIQRATHSPIAGLIENAVIESYAKTLAMNPYNFDKHLVDTARALNILYVYDRTYEPYLIHWLFPVQVAFKEQSQAGEHVYELAMYLDLLNQNCFPSWPRIFAMAEQTLDALEQYDPDFFHHLRKIAQTDPKINPKEFMVYLIHQEKEKAKELLHATPKSQESMRMSWPLLADPLVFLRKWIGEGFVSVLDTPAVLFLWDQNFMQLWQGHAMENMCLALLMLLRHKFMAAKDYTGMKEIFLNGPCRLYTADIQRAWIHVEMSRDLAAVPYLNRQRPSTPPPTPGLTPTPTTEPFTREGPLVSIGIKDVNVKLIIPYEALEQELWLQQFEPAKMKLLCAVYFGEVNLDMRITVEPPHIEVGEPSSGGVKIFWLDFTREQFIFSDLDPSRFRFQPGSYPFVILKVDYLQMKGDEADPIPVGWVKIPLYRKAIRSQPERPGITSNLDEQSPVVTQKSPPQRSGDPQQQSPGNRGQPNTRQNGSQGQTPSGDGNRDNIGQDPDTGQNRATQDKTWQSQQGIPKSNQATPRSQHGTPGAPQQQPKDSNNQHKWVGFWGPKRHPIHGGNVSESALTVPSRPPTSHFKGVVELGSEITCVVFDPTVKVPTPLPTPKTSTPQKTPTPVPPTPETPPAAQETLPPREATPDDRAWVPFKPGAAVDDPPPMEPDASFDLHVDMVRFIPDVASVVKVTGRLLRTGEVASSQDIAAYPEIPTDPRCPTFRFHLHINETKKKLDSSAVLLLRVYTVQMNNLDLVVIGSCLFGLCNQRGKIKTGGYQLKLHSGMPALKEGIAGLHPTDLDNVPSVPCTSLLIRVLPHSNRPVPAPEYRKCYYHSEDARPNHSEWKIFDSYLDDRSFPTDYLDMIRRVKYEDHDSSGTSHHSALQFLMRRLDNKKYLPPQQPAYHLDLNLTVRYRPAKGLKISIQQAFGLPDDVYVQCYGIEVKAKKKKKSSVPPVQPFRFITEKLDYQSLQKAPKWMDRPVSFSPSYGQNNFVYIQVHCMTWKYTPDSTHKKPGFLTGTSGNDISLENDSETLWTAIPLYSWESTYVGIFTVPLFRGQMSAEMKTKFLEDGIERTVFRTAWDETSLHPTAGLVVKLTDNHFIDNEFPTQPLPEHQFVNAVGDATPYHNALNETSGKKVSDLIVDSLEPQLRNAGASGEIYSKEQKFYSKLTSDTYRMLIEEKDGALPDPSIDEQDEPHPKRNNENNGDAFR